MTLFYTESCPLARYVLFELRVTCWMEELLCDTPDKWVCCLEEDQPQTQYRPRRQKMAFKMKKSFKNLNIGSISIKNSASVD